MWELTFQKTRDMFKQRAWRIELKRDGELLFHELVPYEYVDGYSKVNRLLYRARKQSRYTTTSRKRILVMLLNLAPFLIGAEAVRRILHEILDEIFDSKLQEVVEEWEEVAE